MASDQNFLSWPEVTTQPFYQELSDKEKVDLRDKYFTQLVAPTIPQDKLNDGYKEFISNTYLAPESGKELAKTAARESALAVAPTAGAVGLGALARGFARGATSAALEAFPFAAGETAATEGVGALAVPAIELIAGIGGGLYGAYKTAQAQREAINKYVPKETQEEYGLTEEQLAEKAKQYPKTAFAARVAPSLATAGIGVPTTSEALKRAAFSGVLQGGVSAGQQYAETGTIDPKETLMATALGLVQNKPTAFGEAIESRLEGAGQKFGASAQRGLGVNTVFGREAEFVGDPAGAGVFENEPTQPTRLLTGPQATKTAPPEEPPVTPRTPPTPPTVGGDQELSDLLGIQKPKSAAPPVEEPSTITAPTPKPFNDAIADASTDLVEHGGTSADAVNKAVDDAKLGILGESIAAEPGMDVERMAKMLGPQLYGDQSEQAHVTVKELMQNSFDAVKALLDNNSIEKGKIDISTDPTNRSISIIDNGSGMAPKTLATKFLEIAGTQKESDIASGGFGIAKMLTLYANKDIHVTTMRDGKVSELNTTGEDLMKSLSPKSNFSPPSISIRDATPEDRARFPDGHGTHVKITIPENYMSSSNGQKTDIRFLNSYYAPDSVRQSPLFANIDVSYNGRPIENSGSTFPVADYSQWANVKYPWGNARIYVSNEPDPKKATYDNNTYYLSNGLYQFEKKLTKNPGTLFSDAIPYNFYIDLRPNVKPGEAGYPFTFNRKSLTPEAEKDLQKVINYLHKQYSYANAKEDAKSFGGIQYFNKSGKLGKVQNIEPKIAAPKSKFDAISKGDNVEVKNGIVYVGGKEVPELKAEDLKADIPDAGKLTVPQSDIDPNSVMVHDNLTIQTPDGPMEVSNYMRQKFGDRYDKYIHGIGKQFLSLRDIIADALDYLELKEEGVGISIDKEYRGVSIRVPFAASFLNPLIPESPNMLEAAYGFIGTMVHEMAHHKVRSHNASFPAEMQRIEYKLQANKEKEYNAIKRAVVKLVQNNSDIIAEGIRIYAYEDISPTRKRLQDSEERIEPSVSYERISKGNGEPSGEIPAGERVQQPAISGRGASGQRSEAGAGGGRNEKTGPLGGEKTADELRAEMEQKLRGKETVDKSAKDRIDELKNKIKGKFSNLDEAWENFKQKQQNAYNEAQRIQNNLDRRGLLKVEGPKRNNPFDILGNMDSKTEWYVNTKVMPQAKAVMNAVHDYGVAKGLTPDEALNTFGGYLKYLSIPERRKELIRRYMPLATKVVPGAAGSELGKSPAVLREMIYDKAMQTMGNQKIPPDQRAAALRGLSNQLDRIVNDTRNHDPRGESYYPHRKVDERGMAAPLPTDTNDDMFMVTAEAEPEKVRAVLELLKKDLDHPVTGPLLEKALDEFGNLRELKKELDRVGGNWTDWLDDLTEHFYQWKNYAPMKARQGEFDPTELEGKRLAGGVSGFEEGMEGGRHLTENPLTQMFYDTMRSASKAGKANLALTIKNLIDSGEVEGKKVGTVKMTDRFLKPDFLDKEAGGDKYLGGDKINYVLPNGDTEVYRLDNQKLLDGIRRKFQELHWALKGSSWLTGGIAKQYTRFRFAFPVKNFLMHTLANSTQLPMHYLGQVGTFQYLNNVAQHLVSGDGFKMFGLFARRGNPKEYAKYLQDHADNQFVQDAHEWMSQGGMAIFEGGLNLKDAQQKLKSLRVKPVHQRVLAALDTLLENYNRSWDLVSRVSAYGLVKRVELQNGKSLEEAQTIATRVAKNLANFSLSGGDQSSRVLRSLYAFWAPEMTSKVTALDHLRKMFWTDGNIDKLVDKIAPVSESDDPKVQEQRNAKERATARQRLLQERRYAKQGAATMIGSGVFLHFLKNSWAYALAAGGLLTWEQYQKLQEKKEKESRATRSFRIPVTADGETYLDLPYGFSPNNLIGIGEQIGGLADGSQNFKEFGQNTSKIISEFLPKQTSDISPTKDPLTWAAYMVSPTALELPMMLLANKDSRGHSIYNEYATKTPAAYTGGAGVPDQYKTLSIWMYHNLGVDVPPNVAYTFMTSYLDGVHDLLGMGYAANQIATGQGVKATDLKPFAGSFISRRTDAANEDYVGIKSKIEKIGQAFNDPDTEQAAKYIQTHQNEVAAYEIFKGSQGAINKLERDLNTIQRMPNLTPVQKQEYSKQLRDAMDVYKRAIVENAARYGVEP